MHDAFQRDGYVVVPGVVRGVELAAMRAVFDGLIPELAYPRGPDGVVREITGAATVHEPLARIAREARFGALVAEVLGAARVQLLQDSMLYKPPHDGGSVAWHQDHTYVGFLVPARIVALRIALCDEDDTNGCMRVVGGSHRWGPIGDTRALREKEVASLVPSLSPEQRFELEHARSLVLAPGDISIHHCLTLHGSGVNTSDRPRKTIILRMFDAACTLDRARLPANADAHFPTEAGGHLAASAFPLVHAG